MSADYDTGNQRDEKHAANTVEFERNRTSGEAMKSAHHGIDIPDRVGKTINPLPAD
ncbi:hypothetical protein [Caballeronia pedi]|uniref:hypothetical protein n=1 Tax=Caballeronia pedi TaxID=1777141 RepID=UPI000AAD2F5B|nr:hypothetical protein [Caballeronia pedi]